jgi:ribonuclease P protein component
VPIALGHPPSARLRNPADFAALRRQGKRIAARTFQTQYRLTEGGEPRLGMAVSRRVSKRAVVRNRIRRIMRESFRARRCDLPSCDVLLIAHTTAAAQPRGALRADLDLIWSRLAALKAHDANGTIPLHS